MLVLLWTLFGCQEPFGADRHDLRGFRIAAVTAVVEAGEVRPTVALVRDSRLWSADEVTYDWAFIERAGDASTEPDPVATGPNARFAVQGPRLALHAWTDTESAWAELDLTPRPPLPLELQTEVLDADAGTVEVAGLTREARRSWSSTPGRSIDTNGVLRITLGGATPTTLARFMATGSGTFLELETNQADWFASDLLIEDEEITTTAIEAGTYSLLVSAIADDGNGFVVQDVFVGPPTNGAWIQGRLLPAEQDLHGLFWATLQADDAASAGLRLIDSVSAEPGAHWDPQSAGCVGVSGRFDPSWLLTGACTRDALVGERVLLDAE